jgi:hypothetical protein
MTPLLTFTRRYRSSEARGTTQVTYLAEGRCTSVLLIEDLTERCELGDQKSQGSSHHKAPSALQQATQLKGL